MNISPFDYIMGSVDISPFFRCAHKRAAADATSFPRPPERTMPRSPSNNETAGQPPVATIKKASHVRHAELFLSKTRDAVEKTLSLLEGDDVCASARAIQKLQRKLLSAHPLGETVVRIEMSNPPPDDGAYGFLRNYVWVFPKDALTRVEFTDGKPGEERCARPATLSVLDILSQRRMTENDKKLAFQWLLDHEDESLVGNSMDPSELDRGKYHVSEEYKFEYVFWKFAGDNIHGSKK